MRDDDDGLQLSRELIDVVIAEVKTNRSCPLNGPWTRDQQNVQRVLAAAGCIPPDRIDEAAANIYRAGIHQGATGLRIRLVAIGRDRNGDLAARYPGVTQLIWAELLGFIWYRFQVYKQQKTQVDQWDAQGRGIKRLQGE